MSKKGSITTSDYLPYEEYQRLLSCLEKDRDYKGYMYCALAFCLALRISDVLKIRWKDILNDDHITVQEKKTKKIKNIHINPANTIKFNEIYKKMGCPPADEYVCKSSRQRDKHLTPQNINYLLKRWKERYNLRVGNFSSHTFRKTFGRYVYNKMNCSEEALVLLNRIFRHASLNTTMIYIGIRDSEIKDIFNSVSI